MIGYLVVILSRQPSTRDWPPRIGRLGRRVSKLAKHTSFSDRFIVAPVTVKTSGVIGLRTTILFKKKKKKKKKKKEREKTREVLLTWRTRLMQHTSEAIVWCNTLGITSTRQVRFNNNTDNKSARKKSWSPSRFCCSSGSLSEKEKARRFITGSC